jgi:hypothetical protein
MTEVAASLIGIATFGIKLTTTLYEFGANAASAREQTDRIARHLRLYSEVLEVLVDRIDDGEPIHSPKALSLVDEIYDQSYDLFDSIKDLIPKKGDRMSFMRKIAWNFKKSRVALVVSEIEYLKSTVTLLVTVLFAGKKIRSSRRKRRSRKDSKKDREEVDLECAKVKIAIVEQINASAHKLNMQVKVEEEERKELATEHENKERALTRPGTGILQHSMEIVNFRESLGQTEDQGEERALVLNHSSDLIANLLDQWTTLADDATSSSSNQGNGPNSGFGDLDASKNSQPDQTAENLAPMDDYQQGEATSSKISGKQQEALSREEQHRDMLTEAYLDVRNRAERAEEELARLRASLQHPEKSTEPELSRSSTKVYLPDTSSSASGVSFLGLASSALSVICGSDQRDLRESVINDAEKKSKDTKAESESESLWYSHEAEGLRGDKWRHSDDQDEQKWKAHQERKQAETAVRMKERDAEIQQLLRRRQAGTTEGESTIRNQRDASGSQPRRRVYFESEFNDERNLHQPNPPSRPRGADSPRGRISSPSHVPRARADPDMVEQLVYPKSTRHVEYFDPQPVRYTEQQATNTGTKYNPNVAQKFKEAYEARLRKEYDDYDREFLPKGGQAPSLSAEGKPGGGFGGMPGGGTHPFRFTSNGGQGFSFSDPNDISSSSTRGGAAGGPSDGHILNSFNLFGGSFRGGRSAGSRRTTGPSSPHPSGNRMEGDRSRPSNTLSSHQVDERHSH